MNKTFVFLALGVLFLGALASQSRDPVQVELNVNPTDYSGPCPVVVKMTARITFSVAARASARFIASNGRGSTPKTLTFSAPGSQEISDSFSFNGNFTGWVAVELAPSPPGGGLAQTFVSGKVNLSLICQPPPVITDVSNDCGSVELRGDHFGAVQGTRKVRVDGHISNTYAEWKDENIRCQYIINEPKNYEFVIVDAGGNPLSNTFAKKFKMCWADDTPSEAHLNSFVIIHPLVAANRLSNCIVKLGDVIMTRGAIFPAGAGSQIQVHIAQIATGTYNIGVFVDGVNVMRDRSFTVLP